MFMNQWLWVYGLTDWPLIACYTSQNLTWRHTNKKSKKIDKNNARVPDVKNYTWKNRTVLWHKYVRQYKYKLVLLPY